MGKRALGQGDDLMSYLDKQFKNEKRLTAGTRWAKVSRIKPKNKNEKKPI